MSDRAPQWWEQKYVKGVTYALQSAGWLLKPFFDSSGTIEGKTATWKIAGTGKATRRSDVVENRPVMNADRTVVNATTYPYEANDWINTTDVTLMSESEQTVVQETAAMAMGRCFDTTLIGTMDAATTAIETIGDGSAAIDITKAMLAISKINAVGAGGYEFACALPFSFMDQLEVYKIFSNSQYVGDEFPLQKKAGARIFRGCTFMPVPDEYFASPVANSFDAYLWLKKAVGFTWNKNWTSRTDYVAEKKAYFAGNDMAFASAVLLPNGIKRLRFANNIALALPSQL